MFKAIVFLHRLEAEEDERTMDRCEDVIKKYLAKHPDGKAPMPFQTQEEFTDYMAFIEARNKLERLARKAKKRAAAAAVAAIEKAAADAPGDEEAVKENGGEEANVKEDSSAEPDIGDLLLSIL